MSISHLIGGAERVLYEQTTRLSKRGHNVFILTRKLPFHAQHHEVIKGVHELRYACDKDNKLSFFHSTLKNCKTLFEALHKRNKFDCINFHQPFSALGINLSKLSKTLPKIYTCHSLSFEEFYSRNRNGNKNFYKPTTLLQAQAHKKIEQYGLKKSKVIVALSKFTEEKLVKTYKIPEGKIKIIPGGADLERFHRTDSKASIRKQLDLPQNKIIFLTVRNLVQRMGLENLIIAFNEVRKGTADIRLVIGGTGPLENKLKEMAKNFGIENDIYFCGFISEKQLPQYYQMADLFILPTRELEGFGLVTIEAMASGIPVLGTPVGGTTEIIGRFDPDFLFEGTDPDSMVGLITEKIHLIKHHPIRWQKISHRCRNFVEQNYSWEKNIDSLEELIAKNLTN